MYTGITIHDYINDFSYNIYKYIRMIVSYQKQKILVMIYCFVTIIIIIHSLAIIIIILQYTSFKKHKNKFLSIKFTCALLLVTFIGARCRIALHSRWMDNARSENLSTIVVYNSKF